jgi:hypothetical protein
MLQRENDAMTQELGPHRASDHCAEIQRLTQMLLNAEAKIASFEEKAKSLRWFGDKFAELRRLLNVKFDRDVLTRVRELVGGGPRGSVAAAAGLSHTPSGRIEPTTFLARVESRKRSCKAQDFGRR